MCSTAKCTLVLFLQFSGKVLDCCMYLLDVSELNLAVRGNPIPVVRKLTAMVSQTVSWVTLRRRAGGGRRRGSGGGEVSMADDSPRPSSAFVSRCLDPKPVARIGIEG